VKVFLSSTTKGKRGTHEDSQQVPFGNGLGVYGRLFHLFDRLRIDKGWGRTTCGNRQSSSGRRSGSQPANRPTSRICEARELLGERENHPGRSHDDYRKTNILRACTTGISSPEACGEEGKEHHKARLSTARQDWVSNIRLLSGHGRCGRHDLGHRFRGPVERMRLHIPFANKLL
jgi:hypothetical protein